MLCTESKSLLQFTKVENKGKTTAVIVAAGSSSRMGGTDKQFAEICGKPVLFRSISAFENSKEIDNIVVVTKPQNILKIQQLAKEYCINKITDIVEGGETRAESVKNGIAAAGSESEIVLIHDGARPLVTADIIESVINAVELYGAAAPAVAVLDTIKIVDEGGKIISTPPRKNLAAMQTPQGFKRDTYIKALESINELAEDITDDCMVFEKSGNAVYTVPGSTENIKITSEGDLKLAEDILKARGDTE